MYTHVYLFLFINQAIKDQINNYYNIFTLLCRAHTRYVCNFNIRRLYTICNIAKQE